MGYIMDLRKVVGTRPLIMVGANVILLDSNNRMLLQLRKDNHCWGLAGGALELGENLEEVAKRELYEETGLKANQLTFFNIFSGKPFYYKYPHGDEVYNVIASYICRDYSGELKKQECEVAELRFYELNNLPENLNPSEAPIIKQFIEQYGA